MLGKVIKYDRIAGYGFIVSDQQDDLPDFFVLPKFIEADRHHRFLVPGWRVEFEPFDIDGKPQAHHVRVISKTIAIQRGAAPSSGESQSLHKTTANPNPQDESRVARQIGEARAAKRRSVSTVRPGEAWSSDAAEGE